LNLKLQHVRIKQNSYYFVNFSLISLGTWDFVEIYCLRQCAPLLGDHKYWNRVKHVAGIPMYINPVKHEIYPTKQVK